MRRALRWPLALLIALVHDAADVLGPGSIPVVGDAVDVVTTLVLVQLVERWEPALTAVELAPAIDPLPTYTAAVAWAFLRDRKMF